MDGSELYGKVLRCSIARTMPKLAHGKALWTADEWIENNLNDEETMELGGGEVIEPANMAPTNE